ncbi:hydrogenase [Thermoplasmatales archaeon SM1-50]|nr:MAG: hydrogenase [Thermoplasmatales archaeon SM1-50]
MQGETISRDFPAIDAIIKKYGERKEFLICILQDIQARYGYLPREDLERVAEKLGIPLIQIYSVATFFKAFSLRPKGGHTIQVCLGTACHVRGAERVLSKIKRDLDIDVDETTKDMNFTLKTVNCLGACALGPIVEIDGKYHGNMNTTKVESVLKKYSTKMKE